MNRVKVRMEADIVLFERRDHVCPPSFFEHARLFADDLECGPDMTVGEHLRQSYAGIIIGREQVVFGIKPEDDIDGGCACGRN